MKLSQQDHRLLMEQAQRTFVELRNKQMEFSKQLNTTRNQIAVLERGKKRAELTLQELSKVDASTRTFVGVGRMFMLTPRQEIDVKLKKTIQVCEKDELPALMKKREYLERQVQDTTRNLQELRAALPS
eukprot:EC724231.1.p1 GENE.EC724231.1~~EC724231.1.p1  ORF type:complete len:129 (+),score=29.50 EC724231.1:36-422(+)